MVKIQTIDGEILTCSKSYQNPEYVASDLDAYGYVCLDSIKPRQLTLLMKSQVAVIWKED